MQQNELIFCFNFSWICEVPSWVYILTQIFDFLFKLNKCVHMLFSWRARLYDNLGKERMEFSSIMSAKKPVLSNLPLCCSSSCHACTPEKQYLDIVFQESLIWVPVKNPDHACDISQRTMDMSFSDFKNNLCMFVPILLSYATHASGFTSNPYNYLCIISGPSFLLGFIVGCNTD